MGARVFSCAVLAGENKGGSTGSEPLLDAMEGVQFSAAASREGDNTEILAEVTGLRDEGGNKRLRLFLVEEAVRYSGNIVRTVVRPAPSPPTSWAWR
jgi:hypothetical protein